MIKSNQNPKYKIRQRMFIGVDIPWGTGRRSIPSPSADSFSLVAFLFFAPVLPCSFLLELYFLASYSAYLLHLYFFLHLCSASVSLVSSRVRPICDHSWMPGALVEMRQSINVQMWCTCEHLTKLKRLRAGALNALHLDFVSQLWGFYFQIWCSSVTMKALWRALDDVLPHSLILH